MSRNDDLSPLRDLFSWLAPGGAALLACALGLAAAMPASAQVSCTITYSGHGFGPSTYGPETFKDLDACKETAAQGSSNSGLTGTCSCSGAGATAGGGITSTNGAVISNTGNFKQDILTNGVNLGIAMNVKNPYLSAAMQGATAGFFNSIFGNSPEADRQRALLNAQIAQQQALIAEQQRIARQQAIDAMFARLNRELKLSGTAPDLQMKLSSNSEQPLGLKLGTPSGSGSLQLKTGDAATGGGYGIPGLAGIYTGGERAAGGTGLGPPNISGGAANGGIAGLPGIFLSPQQISQAPQIAQTAITLQGPERGAAEDLALAAAKQNAALQTPSDDPAVQGYQQANAQYQQAQATEAQAALANQQAQEQVQADQSAIAMARQQLGTVTPTPEQQSAFNTMLAAQKSDEDASMQARQGFDTAGSQLAVTRDTAAVALAHLPASAAVTESTNSAPAPPTVATNATPALLRSPAPPTAAGSQPVVFRGLPCTIPANSAPARVLLKEQPAIEEIDRKIEHVQEALRRLIETNEANAERHKEWEEESNEATKEAKKIGVNLVIDLAAANYDHRLEENAEEAGKDLEKLMTADPLQPLPEELQRDGEELIREREYLTRSAGYVKAIGKEKELSDTMEESDNHKFGLDKFYTVISQIKKVEEVQDKLGPWKDLVDAAYEIFHQAVSLDQLAQADEADEKTLQASAALQRTIQSLVAQRQEQLKHGEGANSAAETESAALHLHLQPATCVAGK